MNSHSTIFRIQRIRVRGHIVVVLAAVFCSLGSLAQDIHFSQFFTHPLTLNPAHTGYYDGNYRIGFNFKAQWPWAINGRIYNHHTETPYLDFSFGERKIKTGWMGIGFQFLNDVAGDGSLTYRRFGISYAYHQALDKDHRYIVSAGVGLNYIIRSVNFSRFFFNNQWVDDFGFNLSIDPNEPLQRESFSMIDLNAGVHFGAQVHRQLRIDGGFSMLHINRPRHSFLNTNERLGFRYQAEAGTVWDINEKVSLTLNAYYGFEKKASEIMFGSLMSYGFAARKRGMVDNRFYIGMYYRVKDALAPMAGYEFRKTRLIFSYDVTLSGLSRASRANGGPELSLVHVGSWGKDRHQGNKVYCPRFN